MGDTGVRRLDSLTSLRFFAAAYVMCLHTSMAFGTTGIGHRVLFEGYTGVGFFFVLSGFVLAWSYRFDGARAFYRRRFARVWPLHALTAAAALVILPQPSVSRMALAVVLMLALLHAWWPWSAWMAVGNGVSWSLSCEAFFYALLPAVMRTRIRMSPWRDAAAILAVGAVVAVALRVALPTPLASQLVYFTPWFRVVEFLIGVQLGRAFRAGWRPRLVLGQAGLVVAGCLALFSWFDGFMLFGSLGMPRAIVDLTMAAPFGLLICAAAARDADGGRSPLRHPWLVRLGDWSFAVYLVHFMVISVMWRNVGHGTLTALAVVPVAVAVSGLLHHWFERPLERRLRGSATVVPVGSGVRSEASR